MFVLQYNCKRVMTATIHAQACYSVQNQHFIYLALLTVSDQVLQPLHAGTVQQNIKRLIDAKHNFTRFVGIQNIKQEFAINHKLPQDTHAAIYRDMTCCRVRVDRGEPVGVEWPRALDANGGGAYGENFFEFSRKNAEFYPFLQRVSKALY